MRTFLRSLAIAAAAMLLAAGCVKVALDIAVNPDGSGSYEAQVEVAQEFIQMAAAFQEGGSESSAEEVCQEIMQGEDEDGSPFQVVPFSGTGANADQEVIADDSSCGMVVRAEWPAEEAGLAFAFLEEDGGPLIERIGSQGWKFEMPFEFFDEGDAEEIDRSFAGLLDFSFVVSVALPGQPVGHNADSTRSGCDATTFKWDVDVTNPPDVLSAETDGKDDCGGGGWGTGPIVAVAMLGVVVVAIAAALLFGRSRRTGVEPDSVESEVPAPDNDM